jgi:biotin carboxylase
MKSHIAFVDANFTSLEAVSHATREGYYTTFIGTSAFRKYPDNKRNRSILADVDEFIYLDVPLSIDNITGALRHVNSKRPIDAVIGMQEMTISEVTEASKSIAIRTTPVESVRICRDKSAVRERLNELGLPNTEFRSVDSLGAAIEAADAIGYPVMFKPRSGVSSLLAYRINDREELSEKWILAEQGLVKLPQALHGALRAGSIIEAYLKGPMVSVEIGVQDSNHRIYMISGRRRCVSDETLDYGIDMPAWLSESHWTECAEYATQICKALKLNDGIFHLEMIVTDAGPVLVDANCRLMGGNMPLVYQNLTGGSIYEDLIQYFLRRPLPEQRDPRGFGYSSSIRFEAAESGVWQSDDLADMFEDAGRVQVIEIDLSLASGIEIKAGHIIARVQLFAATVDALKINVDGLLDKVESTGGVPLLR